MKILSPVNSFLSAKSHIENGADEIFVGLKTDIYKRYTFSGRGQTSKQYESVDPNEDELKEIVKLAHKNGVSVSLTANVPFFSDSLYGDVNIEDEYVKYVEKGIECGVDNIIVGDIGLLYKLSKMNLPVNIHASTFFDTMSVEQLKFLKELGVSRAVLTYQIDLEEVELLCKANIMEIEVFGYLSCSFFNGSCNMAHDRGEVSKDENLIIGIPCKSLYNVKGEFIEKNNYPFFDAELGCSLCSLYKLKDLGVDVVKIAGRERDYDMMSKVTSLFRKALDSTTNLNEEEYEKSIPNLTYDWWKRFWCRSNKCKFKKNEITNSYIGIL